MKPLIEPPAGEHILDSRAWALAMGARGFRVFPLSPDKSRPTRKGWTEFASSDSAEIKRLFTDALGGSSHDNIGILTGGDLMAFDVDVKEGPHAIESLNDLKRIGLPSATFTTRTPSGGLHLLFRVNSDFCYRNATKWRPGIDLRGHHGFVVAPGSVRPNGTEYTIDVDLPVADLPEAFAEMIREPHRTISDATAKVTAEYEDDWSIGEAIKLLEASDAGGWEHDSMVKLAHKIFDLGVTPTTALGLFGEHWPFELDPGEDLEYQLGNITDGRERDGKAWGVDHPRRRPSVYLTFERVEITVRNAPRDVGLRIVRGSSLASTDAPPRPWLVHGLVPDHSVAMLSGDGGVGKSLLALQLVVAVTSKRLWIGHEVGHGAAVFASAEDDEDEVHRRLNDICRAEDVNPDDLHELHVIPLAGLDAVLGAPNPAGGISPTKLFAAFSAAMEKIRPRLIVLDTLADVFGGDEVVRVQARQFVGLLRGLAISLDCVVLLLAHPSLSGMASGAGTSGSTAWNNSVRGRLYLTRPTEGTGKNKKTARGDERVLSTKKMNYAGGVGDEIALRWEAGRFRRDADRVKVEIVDRAAVLARALKDNFAPGESVRAGWVYDALSPEERGAFGSRPNLASKIRTLIADAGQRLVKGEASLPTKGGRLIFYEGKTDTSPFKVCFVAASSGDDLISKKAG